MGRGRLSELLLAVIARFVLGRVQGLASLTRKRSEARREGTPAMVQRPDPVPPRRGPLMLLMLASFGLGLPLMILFEATFTRVLGVALMFTFIVSGVFLIANPVFLAQEEE